MADPTPERLRQVGAMIIRRRLERGMKTKIKLGDASGLSTRVLGDIEAGKRRAGSVTYIQIETALGWPPRTIEGYLDGSGSLLDDEVASDSFVDTLITFSDDEAPGVDGAGDAVDPLEIDDDAEAMQEFLRQRAERKGKSVGRAKRSDQDRAESGSQDPGGMEPS